MLFQDGANIKIKKASSLPESLLNLENLKDYIDLMMSLNPKDLMIALYLLISFL